MATTLVFWMLAVVPGLVHPFLLFIYYRRYQQRRSELPLQLNESPEQWMKDFNLPSYVYPVLLSSLLSIAAAVVLIAKNEPTNQLKLPQQLLAYVKLVNAAAIAGFAGSYIAGLYDFVNRIRILSRQPGVMHLIWFRLLLGPILGAYLQTLMVPALVFVVTTLPVARLWKWVQEMGAKQLKVTNPTTGVLPRWNVIQGVTDDILDRLEEAGVGSVVHLAYQDPLDLFRRTNIDWRIILDMMDQAYLACYVGERIALLRPRGISGAIDMAYLCRRLKRGDADAAPMIQAIAHDLQEDENSVRNLLQNLWADTQVDRIFKLWFRQEWEESKKIDQASAGKEAAAAAGA